MAMKRANKRHHISGSVDGDVNKTIGYKLDHQCKNNNNVTSATLKQYKLNNVFIC